MNRNLNLLRTVGVAVMLVAMLSASVMVTPQSGLAQANTPPVAGFGNALNFNEGSGTSDEFVEIPYDTTLNPDSFTVEGWVYTRQSSSFSAPFSSRDASTQGNTKGWNVYNTSAGRWEFWFGSGGGGWFIMQGPAVQLDTWTHIAATYGGGTAKFYVDGVLRDTKPGIAFVKNTAKPFRIGASDNGFGANNAASWFFNGYVDEVRVWDSARTEQQIADYRFRYIQDPTSEPGLLAYWAFNSTSGTVLPDLAGGHNGTLRNMEDSDWVASTTPALVTDENQPVSGHLKASDDDSDPLTFALESPPPGHGSVGAIDGTTGAFTYTPDPQWCGADSFSYKVNDGSADSNVATARISITCLPDTGLTVGNAAPVGYTENDPATIIAPNLTLDLGPGQVVAAARIEISNGYQSGADVLGIQGQTGSSGTVEGLTWTWNATSGVLSLTGSGDWAKYQAAMRQVTYVNTSDDPTGVQRTVRFSLGSGLQYAGNSHFYEFVPASAINWQPARDAAAAKSYFGRQGYLSTVTDAGENNFIAAKLKGEGWMGASDEAVEGEWRWVTGPEANQQFWQGGPASSGGQPVSGRYNNWASTEPNNADSGGEDHAHFKTNAEWNDFKYNNSAIKGYVVEYGGLPTDANLPLAGNAQINVTPVNDAPTNLALSSTTIQENQPPGTVVGTFSQDDLDGGPTFTYQLGTAPGCDGSDSAAFYIEGNQLKTTREFDYEAKDSYQICVRVRDGKGGEALQAFTIGIEDEQIAPAFGVQPPPLNGFYKEPYSYAFYWTSGDPDPTFSLFSGSLPPGLSLSPDGVLSGTPTEPGNYGFTVEASNGVAPPTYKTVTVTIFKWVLTLEIDDQFKKQGNPNPALTYKLTGFQAGDDESVLDVKPTLVTTATDTSPVGVYLITLADPQPSDDNYAFLSSPGVLAIGVKDVPVMDWSSPVPITYGEALTTSVQLTATAVGTDSLPLDGTFAYDPPAGTLLEVGNGQVLKVTFTPDNTTDYIEVTYSTQIDILPAALTITAEDKTIAAGEPLPALTAAYSGLVAGDTSGDLDTPVSLSTSANPNQAGTYEIEASGAKDKNYDISFVNGTLTVELAGDNGGVGTGAPGSTFPYVGKGFVPGEVVTVKVTGPGGSPVVTTTATADVDGVVKTGIYLDPGAPEGPHQVEVTGPSGTVSQTVTVDGQSPVVPPGETDVQMNGRPAGPGSEVPYVGTGFTPGEQVAIKVNGRVVGTGTADQTGTVNTKLVFDPNTPPGPYEVTGVGTTTTHIGHVSVETGAPQQQAPGDAPKVNTAPIQPDGYVPFEAGGFTPGQQVPILVNGQQVGTVQAGPDGKVKTYVHLDPNTPEGTHTIEAGPGGPQEQFTTSKTDGDVRPNPGGVPVVSNSNPVGAPGGYFPFTGEGYQPGERVTIQVNGLPVGTVTADENGQFSTVIQPDPSKTSETLELTAAGPSGASTQARATIDPAGPELHKPDGVAALSDKVRIYLPVMFRNG